MTTQLLFKCLNCGDLFENYEDDSLSPIHVHRLDIDGNRLSDCGGTGYAI